MTLELHKAAKQGDAFAQFNLGVMYYNGDGVPQDYSEAAKWYRKAAEQGHAKAQSNLGVMYADGKGVPKDYVKAYMWLEVAVTQASFEVADLQGYINAIEEYDRIAKLITSAQIAEAQEMARNWKPTKP